MFQEIIEKLCPEENGLCVRARRAREELVFLPLSQMYGYEAPRKHIEALLSFSDAIGLQLARDFFGNGLMIGFNSKDCGLMPTECATAQKKENKEPLRSASGGRTAQNRILTEREEG